MLLNASINYLSVLVAAIAAFAVGMLWYGPLFGKYWMKLMNITPQSMKKMKSSKWTPMHSMILGFVALLVTGYVLAHLLVATGATTVSAAICLSAFVWAGFLAPLLLSSFLWEGKSINLWVFNAAHRLVEIVVMAIVLALMN